MIKRTTAAFAVSAFGLVLGAGASLAAGQTAPCGTPAVEAQYRWVVTQPPVSEVSHLEFQWARQTAPAHTEWKWTRTVTTTIYKWKLWVANTATPQEQWSATSPGANWVNSGDSKVVVTAPEVTAEITEYEFKLWDHKTDSFVDGTSKWRDTPTWNANDSNGKPEGWEPTGVQRTRTVVVTEAKTETQYRWVEVLPAGHWEFDESATSPGGGWVQDSVVSTTSNTEEKWSETEPEGDGWTKTGESKTTPVTYEYTWAAESPGDGWTQTESEPKTVIDVVGVPEKKEWQVVVPAVPAGPPCPVDETPEQPPVDQPPVNQPPVDQTPDESPVDETPDEGPVVEKPTPVKTPAKPEAAPVAQRPASAVPQVATAAVTPTRLAHTGSDLTLLWTGLGLIVVGAGLSAGYRRSTRED